MSKTVYLAILISILATVLISANTGGLYIYALDEAKNSTCAREMMERDDMVVPTFNYKLRGDKPPLHYYFMMAAYRFFGVNEFAARFFSVIMGVLTVLALYLFTGRYINRNAALFTAIALISSFHFALQFHMAVPDPYLVFFLTLGWIFLYISLVSPGWKNAMIMYASFALATLAKGPVAVVLPGISLLGYLLLSGKLNLKVISSLKPVPGIALYLLITLPWFIMVHIKTLGEWTKIFFLENNLDRYTSTMEGHGAFFLATPLIVIAGMLPFSVIMIQSMVAAWKKRKENEILLYCLSVILTIVIFFSFSKTKLPNYTVPTYPFLAILAGWYIDKVLKGEFRKPFVKSAIWIYLIMMIAIPFALYFILSRDPLFEHLKNISWYFILLPAGAFLGLIFLYNHNFLYSILSLSVSWIIMTLLFFYLLFPKIDRENPVAKILPLIDKSEPVAVYGLYNPAFSFYLKKPFTPLNDSSELADFVHKNPEAYIISRSKRLSEINKVPGLKLIAEEKDMFEIPTTVVLKVQGTIRGE